MALTSDVNWYIRSTATGTNSGGFDPVIGAAGTNRADADTSFVNGTNLTVDGSDNTKVTPDGHTPTSADVGNVVVISAGAGFTLEYYTITAEDGSLWTLDRSPAATSTSGGTWSMGGAFADGVPLKLDNTAPTITSPLAAGHTVNVRGDGTDDPSTVHYQASNSYVTPASGTLTSPIRIIGYNGRPHWKSGDGMLWYNNSFFYLENLKLTTGGSVNASFGIIYTAGTTAHNIRWDSNGTLCQCFGRASRVTDCYFGNSGATTASSTGNGTVVAYYYVLILQGCVFEDQRTCCVNIGNGNVGAISDNVFISCRNTSKTVSVVAHPSAQFVNNVCGNTFDNCAGNAITAVRAVVIQNNLFTRQSAYAISAAAGHGPNLFDFNGFGSGTMGQTSGQYNVVSGGSNDVTLGSNVDPYVDKSSGDYALDDTNGADLKAVGFPGAFLGIATTSYVDIGAVQRQEPAGGGSSRLINGGLIS